MRTTLLIILFILFSTQSYSQDFGEIKLDSKLQIKYSDSLKNIGERLSGKWKYLGKRQDETLSDTLGGGSRNGKWIYEIVENGIAYEIVNGKRQKTEYYYEITFDFKKKKGFYNSTKKYLNENIFEVSSDQPIPELIYYKSNFGILFTVMVGQDFQIIRQLNDEKLILESGKEYLKIE